MAPVQVTFLGSGDAFSSGGKLNTSILVRTNRPTFLIDFGASGMVSIRRFGVNPNDIQLILLSHLHGDHFGGIPFFIIDAQLVSKRTAPLTIAGPPGAKQRILDAMEVLFPGSSTSKKAFDLNIVEYDLSAKNQFLDVGVTPFVVNHPSGAPSLALRIECEGKIIAFSGDTEWVDTLVPAASQADLFISECYVYDKKVKYHLDYKTLVSHLDEINPKRMIVTHMSNEMLAMEGKLDCKFARDGLVLEL